MKFIAVAAISVALSAIAPTPGVPAAGEPAYAVVDTATAGKVRVCRTGRL